MQTIKFVTFDKAKGKVLVWCTTNEQKMFYDFMQYALDSCDKPEDFLIWDTKADLVYKMYDVATKQYGMRKRTFEERMKNVKTYVSN